MLIFKPKRMHVTCENCGASEGDAPASLPGLCLEPIKGLTAPPPPPPPPPKKKKTSAAFYDGYSVMVAFGIQPISPIFFS